MAATFSREEEPKAEKFLAHKLRDKVKKAFIHGPFFIFTTCRK
jgi:hypothetical protein